MLSQSFSDPSILSVVCSDYHNQVVPGSIVRVEEVGDNAQEAETTRHDNELIFVAELSEYVLLEFLSHR